jgi:hypothetical protein
MNVYKVILGSEKDILYNEVWQTEATSVSAAVGKALRRSQHNTARKVNITCRLLAKNMTKAEYIGQDDEADV